jgi:hypothetical protein
MGAAKEARYKAASISAHQRQGQRLADLERAAMPKTGRAIAQDLDAPPSKSVIRRWMRLHVAEYDGATQLAEGANAEFGLPSNWLDNPDHWIWEMALQEFGED